MNFKQYYLGCLAHASYYLGSHGEAAVIDPQRDIQQYVDQANSLGQTIKYVIETHSHADFVSGHVELAARTGAQIVYGEKANTTFATLKVRDGDKLSVGSVELRFVETPGHTPEGITVLAIDKADADAPQKLFTGDTLFIGDVGRPDLPGSAGFSAERMAEMLYDSLQKILTLPDETEIYPAHGAGSLCGKSLSKERSSTLGEQRHINYALQSMSREEFVSLVTADQPEVPAYFHNSGTRNLEGPLPLDEIQKPRQFTKTDVDDFAGTIIDVRTSREYGAGHIPNSINIGLVGQFASFAGTLVSIGSPIIVAASEKSQIDEATIRLARVGHETVLGYILVNDYDSMSCTGQVGPSEAAELLTKRGAQLIDVRRASEYNAGHALGAVNIPLDKLEREISSIDRTLPTYVICQGGYRSSIATGILEKAGFTEPVNIVGGTEAWLAAGLPAEAASIASA